MLFLNRCEGVSISQFQLCVTAALMSVAGICPANSSNGSQTVLSVGIHDSGHAIVTLAASSNTEGCATSGAENKILIQKTNPNFKAMYATALTALSAGRQVSGYVNGCTDVWGTGSFLVPTATTIFMATQ